PETVKEIGTRAFASCKNLKKVTLSEGLETLGYYAFQGAPVTEICIPATIKSADEPFAGCSALSKVTFGKGITKIPQEMFSYCGGLTEITVPETVKEIGTRAFASCKNLKKVTLSEGLETLGYYAFQGTPITEIIIPSTLKSADEPFAGCKDLTYAHFAEDMVNVPANIFQNAGGLESVQLASTTASIGEHAFDNCRKLSTIYPEDLLPAFRNTTFSNCDQLYDPRFSPLDRTASGITVNSSRSSVNGLMHFTVKYKLDERTADPVLNLSMPETLVLVPESVTGTDPDMTVGNKSDSFQLKALEGTLHFSARMQAAGSAKVQAGMNFKFQNSAWTQTIGTLIVDAPALTVGAPEQVNGLTAPVNGIAGREQPVEIYVNDTLAETVTADAYTGKYRVTVQLPQGDDGAVYQIYAKTAENKTDAVAVTYSKNAPTVQNVWMNYNGHAGKDMDITAVLLEGKSPVISYNPAYPLRFTVKAANSELIDRMFVTSTKGDDIRYLEAFYDAENDVWVTENSFFVPENHSYVPGSLNISILEKEPDLTVSEEDADAYDKMMHLPDSTPQAYRDNSTVNVLAKTDSAFVAEVNFTDGTEDHEFVYCSERTNTVMLDGVTVTAEEIAKDPEKYGYHRVPASAVNGNENCVYYQRWDTGVDDLVIGLSLEALTGVTDALVGEYTGYSLLERIEGDAKDTVEACFVNNFVVATGQNFFNSLTGDVYGDYANYLRIMGDSVHLVSRLYEARDNEMQQCAAVMLFAAQVIVDSGGLELMLLTCGVTAPVAFVVTVGSCVLLTYAGTWLDEWIAGDSMFSSGGILRFIIDPSGIVYEAVLSNPVEDAEVRIYYRDPETGKQTEWNAADYEQENPLRTDTDGAYAWDVPEGEWKVTASKEGYEKAESDWMTVPPVRTDVGLALVDRSAPAIAEITEQQNGLLVQFSKFADIATADEKSIVLKNAKDYAVKPVLHAEGDAYTDQFLLEGDFAAGSYTLAVTEALRSYAGTPAAAAEQTFTVKLNALQKGDIDGDGIISVVDAQLALVEYVTVMSGKDGTFSAAQTKAGDIDGSGSVGVDDAQNILMYYVENRVAGKTVSWEELLERQNPAAA
ncbi:MAG: leucine-rich repeat protein, partial [Oscillospiraceae bacterium]|nr:leucine-rich repeat protein [Oscillospiraceae bacterium]